VIAIVDYGLGNLGSALKAFRRVGAEAALVSDPAALRDADALVLPGDGAFGAAMHELRERGLDTLLRERVAAGVPLLGICVGMQVLFEAGEEHGTHHGLGLLPGRVRRLRTELPVPHMGWNTLEVAQPHPALADTPSGTHVYFVHSYVCEAAPDVVVATTEHGERFPAVVARDNVLGMQFHPEKSQEAGLRLLGAAVRWCAAALEVRR
jgi:glutamine amidotransferase